MGDEPIHRTGKVQLWHFLITLLIAGITATTLIRLLTLECKHRDSTDGVPAVADPVSSSASAGRSLAMHTAKATLMITVAGDYNSTAAEIARDAPVLVTSEELITEAMDIGELGDLSTFRTDKRADWEKLRAGLHVLVVDGSPFIELQFTGPRAPDARNAVTAVASVYKRRVLSQKRKFSEQAKDLQLATLQGLARELKELEAEAQINQTALADLGADPMKLATLNAEVAQREVKLAVFFARHNTVTDEVANQTTQAEVPLVKEELRVITSLRDIAAARNQAAKPLKAKERVYEQQIEQIWHAHRTAMLRLKDLLMRDAYEGPEVRVISPASVAAPAPD